MPNHPSILSQRGLNSLKNLRLLEIFFSLHICRQGSKRKSEKLSSIVKWWRNKELYSLTLNCCECFVTLLTLLHSERPKLHTILAFLSAVGLRERYDDEMYLFVMS